MEFKNKKRANHTEIYEELLKEVQKHFNDQEILLIKKAYLMAKDLHRGQKRNSGEPYIIHPVYVAYILLTEMHLYDVDSIIAALLHDVGTPCFAHCIDYVFGDYLNQETSEASIADIVKKDKELVSYLIEDGICLEELEQLELYPILENKSPQLCTDRLDGVLHTCYIWLHTHSLKEIKEVYDHLVVLENEQGNKEIGLDDVVVAEKFVAMIFTYAKELQGNTDKYVMNYISEIVKLAVQKGLISLEDLYVKTEEEIIRVFQEFFLFLPQKVFPIQNVLYPKWLFFLNQAHHGILLRKLCKHLCYIFQLRV